MPAQPAPIETVGLIGLGYVGLPLALALARGGLRKVVGFDISAHPHRRAHRASTTAPARSPPTS